MKSHSNL